jgi:aspartyl/glutamyl-tRNA(Asn/Gln) amidotransferase C subunit
MVRKLGKLSRLALNDDEIERFGEQTDRIIAYFQSLKALDLKSVVPTSHVIDVECWRRPDGRKETLKCLPDLFPYLKYGYFQVPRILPEDDSDSTTKAPGLEEESNPESSRQDTKTRR